MRLYRHEIKMNLKSFLIWVISMVFVCAGCILLYKSLEESIQGIADTYASMGAMSAAIGMDKVSIATVDGYYATEIALMFNLGAALYAALLGIGMLSKEEAGHTSEFLNTLPISRISIYLRKYAAAFSLLLLFNLLIVGGDFASLSTIGDYDTKAILLYHTAAFCMQLEFLTIAFMISAISKKVMTGVALGLAILLYAADMMCRIVPDLEKCKYITPFYYCSGADIIAEVKIDAALLAISLCITVVSFAVGLIVYNKKDIAA